MSFPRVGSEVDATNRRRSFMKGKKTSPYCIACVNRSYCTLLLMLMRARHAGSGNTRTPQREHGPEEFVDEPQYSGEKASISERMLDHRCGDYACHSNPGPDGKGLQSGYCEGCYHPVRLKTFRYTCLRIAVCVQRRAQLQPDSLHIITSHEGRNACGRMMSSEKIGSTR
jgi:hypothetical protein